MIHRAVDFIIGAFMDKTLFAIIIPQIVALLIVGLNFLFNHLNKNREFEHNEHLKKLELEQREKERKFKVEEKMIEKSIETHLEAFNRLVRIFGVVNQYYTADGTLQIPGENRKEIFDLLEELDDWRRSKGFFLEKTIRQQIGFVANLAQRAMNPRFKPVHPKMDIWEQLYRTIKGLIEALEIILKEYNPLYDLNIKLPKIENP
jgi:hypothetical protein